MLLPIAVVVAVVVVAAVVVVVVVAAVVVAVVVRVKPTAATVGFSLQNAVRAFRKSEKATRAVDFVVVVFLAEVPLFRRLLLLL